MIKACLFSLDGVIVDTARCRFLAWKRLAAELGFEFTELQNESLRGVSRFEALGILLRAGGLTGRFDVGQKVRMASCQAGWYREYVGRMTEADVLPGAVPCSKGSGAREFPSDSARPVAMRRRFSNERVSVPCSTAYSTEASSRMPSPIRNRFCNKRRCSGPILRSALLSTAKRPVSRRR